MRGNRKNLRVLLLHLEFPAWETAYRWTYFSQLGIEEGLYANSVDYFSLTTPWFPHAREICAGKHFDQVWVEIVHNPIDREFLEWISTIAPVRVGFIFESLESTLQEKDVFRNRKQNVWSRLGFMTHIAAADEQDVNEINTFSHVPAFWWPQAVPRRFIYGGDIIIPKHPALFLGVLYGERRKWLEVKDLYFSKSLIEHRMYPFAYDLLHWLTKMFLREKTQEDSRLFSVYSHAMHFVRRKPIVEGALGAYLHSLRLIRQRCFLKVLETIRSYSSIINLPSILKAYAGRVYEGIAAGRPVISWEVPGRPKNKLLFEDGREILLFSKENPEQLHDHIQHILSEPAFGKYIAENARRKLTDLHTIEKRVQQLLDWIESGKEPVYF